MTTNPAVLPPGADDVSDILKKDASRTVRDERGEAAPAGGYDRGGPAVRPVLSDSGAFSANAQTVPILHGAASLPAAVAKPGEIEAQAGVSAAGCTPLHAMLAMELARLELQWLADRSTAPHDDICSELLRQMPLSDMAVAAVLTGRNARFLSALLLRGTSRLWTDGPNSNPQKA